MDQETPDGGSRALPARGTLLLLALSAALLLFRLGDVPLLGPDEPRYARVAVEMGRSGDLVTPTLQGRPWLEKPPLYYWLAAGSMRVLGETEAAARLPSVFAALVLIATTALLGARLHGTAVGLHAGFITGLSLFTFAYGRAAAMDMLLTAALTAGLTLLALRRLGIAAPLAVPAGAALLGLATLAKGPIAVILSALVLGVHTAIVPKPERARLRPVLTLGGIAAFLAVAAPWHALVFQAQGSSFVETFLLNHNFLRFTSTIHEHPGPFYYYVPVILLGFFPWTGLLFPAATRVNQRSPKDLLLAAWALVPLLLFSAAGSKLPGYILPVVPPLAVLMGKAAVAMIRRENASTMLGTIGAIVGLAVGLAAAAAPIVVARSGDLGWVTLMPVAAWAAVLMWLALRLLLRSAEESLRLLRVGAAGFLLLLATAAPPVLERRESGRDLYRAAGGREVLVWGHWRSVWMAGYFYNDGRIREVSGLHEIEESAKEKDTLVLCGPWQRGALERAPGFETRVVAAGPKRAVLIKVSAQP